MSVEILQSVHTDSEQPKLHSEFYTHIFHVGVWVCFPSKQSVDFVERNDEGSFPFLQETDGFDRLSISWMNGKREMIHEKAK